MLQFHPWKDVLQTAKPRDQDTTNGAFETLRRFFKCKHQGLDILVSHFFYIKFYNRQHREHSDAKNEENSCHASVIQEIVRRIHRFFFILRCI